MQRPSEDEAYESKIKEESSSDDEEPDNGENVDERMHFLEILEKGTVGL